MVLPEFLVTAEAAHILGLVPETVRGLERAGKIPAIRLGSGQRLFRREDVERLAAEREAQSARRGRRPTVPQPMEGGAV